MTQHNASDTDGSTFAGHHTLGTRRNQATTGAHRHKTSVDGEDSILLFDGDEITDDDPGPLQQLLSLLEEYGLVNTSTGGGGGGGTSDHSLLSHLDADDHPQYTTDAEVDAIVAAALAAYSGSSFTRGVKGITTSSLADLDTEDSTVNFQAGYRLLNFQCDRACRVRLYKTSAARTADASRPIGTDPTLDTDTGLVFEYVAGGARDVMLSPTVDGWCPTGTTVYYAIQNRSGSTSSVDITFDWLRTE